MLNEGTKDGKTEYLETIQKYLDSGEIVKPEFERLKYDINHFIKRLGDDYVNKNLLSITDPNRNEREDFNEVYYGFPRATNELISFRNKLKRIKKQFPTSELVLDAEKFMLEYVELADKMKELKEKIVTTTQKRQEVKQAKEVVKMKMFNDASSLTNTLMEFIDEYVARAGKMASEQYDNDMERLKAANWDLNVFAPAPNYKMSTSAYQAAKRKRDYFMSLTDEGDGKGIRKASAAKKKKFKEDNERNARADYMAWIHKMVEKIGRPVIKSKVTGNPWTGSTLTVTTDDDKEQVWHTQMIINRSKYGTLFNQFPSRKR